jgi:predicted dehydrogenase
MIRFGIIGPGIIATKFARDIQLADNAKLEAVASRSKEKAEAFAKEYGITHVYGSYLDMVLDNTIDAVYIATPHNFHKEQAILCLQNNKHVLIEKPITVNKKELEEIIDLAKKKNLVVMEAMWSRFLPATKYMKELIASKKFGELQHFELNFGYELSEDYPQEGRILNPNLAGGSILDLGIYPVSIASYLTNNKEIKEIEVDALLHDNGVDLDCAIQVTYVDGTTSELRSSVAQNLDDTGYFYFENQKVEMKRAYYCEEITTNEGIQLHAKGEGFVDQIESFSNTILNGKLENDIVSHKDMLLVMELLDIIRKKANVQYPFEKNES